MKRLLSKKTALIFVLVALFLLSLSCFALSVNKKVYADEPPEDVFMDADEVSFKYSSVSSQLDVNNFLEKGTSNLILQTQLNNNSPTVTLSAGLSSAKIYGGEHNALRVEVRLLYNRWPDLGYGGFSNDGTYVALRVYHSDDTLFTNPIASSEVYGTQGNFIRKLILSPEKVCNATGKLSSFVIRVESDATYWASSIIIDYVKIVFNPSDELFAGDCVTDQNPENVSDANVIWTSAENPSNTHFDLMPFGGHYAYVNDPAFVQLSKERFPSVPCVTESDDTEALLIKNVVFAFDVGNVSADDYDYFIMDILLSDKRMKGGHTLYLYGGNPDKFVDANGDPVGYAAKVMVENYEQGYHNKFILEGADIRKLAAGTDGKISKIYVLYHGNTLDTATETVGLRNGSEIWMNKIQFLTASEVEQTLGTDYEKCDVSDVFPVGRSAEINNKAASNIGDVVSNAALKNKIIGELTFGLKMSTADNICLLFNANGRKQVNEYLDGGILFYLSNGNTEISAHKNGATTKAVSVTSSNAFVNDAKVKIECKPYYLNGIEEGFYCAVWVNDGKILSGYFSNDDLALGNALHLCYEAKAEDFSVKISSFKTEGVKSAEDLMNVKVNAEKIKYSLDKTDVPLALNWYETGFDELSEVACDGKIATVNQEVKRVQFNSNGETKVSYTVTNAFGTFTSNELSLTCEDVVEFKTEKKIYESAWFIALCFLPLAAFGVTLSVIAIRKAVIAKKSK